MPPDSPPRLWELWSLYAGDDEPSRDEWTTLIQRWCEPHRTYHTLEHLLAMLSLLSEQSAGPEAMLATWYHDAIYDPRASDNEAKSARLAFDGLHRLGLGSYADRVAELIEMTATHDGPESDDEALLVLDADLAILGQPPSTYLRYVEGVRREYGHLSDDDFTAGRRAVLRDLLSRDRLYRTDAFGDLEPAARANMRAELAVYGDPSDDLQR